MKQARLFLITLNALLLSCSTPTEDSAFIDDLMARMTLEEKIGQLNLPSGGDIQTGTVFGAELDSLILEGKIGGFFNVKGVDEISRLQHLAVERGPHGIPLLVGADVIHGYETIFPIPLAMSCSWDTTAIERMAQISAVEATADGINWNFSPMVDICRDPRWGRIAEGSGEDPYLGSKMAAAYVRGYQGEDLSADSTLLACVKHFALYGAAEGGRDYRPVDMSDVTMYNYYLPPFKAAVEAGCASLMTSFNLINGTHATADGKLINGLLRTDWKFDGLVASDYNSFPAIATMGTSEIEDAATLALNAGTDMDMVSGLYLKNLKEAVDKGLLSEKLIDKACRRVLEAKQRLGLFENPYKYCNPERAKTDIFTTKNRLEAKEIATETFVLLKNEKHVLPLKKTDKIAVIGPLADAANNMVGCWSMHAQTDKHSSLRDAVQRAVGDDTRILYARGCNIYDDETTQSNATGLRFIPFERDTRRLEQDALNIAEQADVIVAAMGESSDMSGESASRADISIPAPQRRLLEKLKETGKPIVLLLFTGRPLVLDWESENLDAILNVWFGGSEAADAIADVIFGTKIPQGKLTTSFPLHQGQIPIHYNRLPSSRPDPQAGVFNRYQSNYIDVDNEPLYPFGFGLSYTTFVYSNPTISSPVLQENGCIDVTIDVTNTGDYDGFEIVQLYIRDPVAQIARPIKELKDFARVFIRKGETATVKFSITKEKLKYYDANLKYDYDSGKFIVMIGPDSRNIQELSFQAE